MFLTVLACVQEMETAGSPVGAAISLTLHSSSHSKEWGKLLCVHQLPLTSSSSVPSGPPLSADLSSLPLTISFSFSSSSSSFSPAPVSLLIPGCKKGAHNCVCVCVCIHEYLMEAEGHLWLWVNLCFIVHCLDNTVSPLLLFFILFFSPTAKAAALTKV